MYMYTHIRVHVHVCRHVYTKDIKIIGLHTCSLTTGISQNFPYSDRYTEKLHLTWKQQAWQQIHVHVHVQADANLNVPSLKYSIPGLLVIILHENFPTQNTCIMMHMSVYSTHLAPLNMESDEASSYTFWMQYLAHKCTLFLLIKLSPELIMQLTLWCLI